VKTNHIKTHSRTMLADTITPVSIYLKMRDIFPNSLLLESSDYHATENSYSFICLKQLAFFEVDMGICKESFPDGTINSSKIKDPSGFNQKLSDFISSFETSLQGPGIPVNGLFGYCSYDAVQYFENIKFNNPVKEEYKVPDLHYGFYKIIIAINHFRNSLQIIENLPDNEESEMDRIESLLNNRNIASYYFKAEDDEDSNLSDKEYKEMVSKGKKHCYRGDVFQVVLSRQYSRSFTGDDFNVYRALRSINHSPYLFYFNYGNFRIFGSSPEAQLKIANEVAYINPIAGTFKRTGDDSNDKVMADRLATDPKENAEHVMLVDLARNDLSRHARDVKVDSYREVQYYSHVIHLVSSVSGKLNPGSGIIDMLTATFPAGTLTGAPKYKAMQIIDSYENQNRGYYGGALGYIGFDGKLNHAIMIRTFLSKKNRLFYQAGAGIVAASNEENELQEVNNKLGALKKAVEMACEII